MTTVVYRAGVLAADRRATMDGTITKCTKLFRVGDYAIGVSGGLSCGVAFQQWFGGDRSDECPLDKHTSALVMDMDTGLCEQWEAPGAGIPVEDEFAAIGSGKNYAYGAMEMGADAKEAVKAAAKWNSETGGGVQVIKSR